MTCSQIDYDKLENERWNYIKKLYPKAFNAIRDYNFSVDEEKNPYDLWIGDKQMYYFFDKAGIYVCPVKTDEDFKVIIHHKELQDLHEHCKDRYEAELKGFMSAFGMLNVFHQSVYDKLKQPRIIQFINMISSFISLACKREEEKQTNN